MPMSIRELFRGVGLNVAGIAGYGSPVREGRPGVYVVANTADVDTCAGCGFQPTLSMDRIAEWIRRVPAMHLAGSPQQPAPEALRMRLLEFWLPDEPVLYIGKAGTTAPSYRSIKDRVADLYDHVLGDRRPHRGGHWLKTLGDLDRKFIFWGVVTDGRSPDQVESEMLAHFVSGVSPNSKAALRDRLRPFPWADLEHPKGNRKNHGILNQTL